MPDLYRHSVTKFSDLGLALRLPVDLVPAGAYSRYNNAISDLEGQIQTRAGLTPIATVVSGQKIHTIFRLNQQTTAISPERIVGVGTGLYSQQLPSGAFAALTGLVYDGTPLTIVPFRFDADPASWAIISNSQGMMKRRRNLYQKLGQTAPTAPCTASAGGAGNLNNGAGPGYDWRATYVNSTVNTESNPSPVNSSTSTSRPSANTTPDAISGGNAATNPANAYDNNPATFAQLVGDAGAQTSQSVRYSALSGITTTNTIVLYVDSEVDLTNTDGYVIVSIFYSTNNGGSWNTLYTTQVSQVRGITQVALPVGVDLTQLLIRAVASGSSTAPAAGSGTQGAGGDTGGEGGRGKFQPI